MDIYVIHKYIIILDIMTDLSKKLLRDATKLHQQTRHCQPVECCGPLWSKKTGSSSFHVTLGTRRLVSEFSLSNHKVETVKNRKTEGQLIS